MAELSPVSAPLLRDLRQKYGARAPMESHNRSDRELQRSFYASWTNLKRWPTAFGLEDPLLLWSKMEKMERIPITGRSGKDRSRARERPGVNAIKLFYLFVSRLALFLSVTELNLVIDRSLWILDPDRKESASRSDY